MGKNEAIKLAAQLGRVPVEFTSNITTGYTTVPVSEMMVNGMIEMDGFSWIITGIDYSGELAHVSLIMVEIN